MTGNAADSLVKYITGERRSVASRPTWEIDAMKVNVPAPGVAISRRSEAEHRDHDHEPTLASINRVLFVLFLVFVAVSVVGLGAYSLFAAGVLS